MQLPPIIRQLNDRLSGWPDSALTAALIVAALALIALALSRHSTAKAVALAWVIAP